MANIQILDQNTINQIAAGEVIERPASVVKELLENAIDSKATAITVEIQGGGLSVIRVTDNGCGIPGGEIPMAFTRHATSKIRTAEDLFTVASLGFRGEALASIASIAKVELITKTTGSICGSRYRIEGGEEIGLEEIGAPEGTTFIARDLFYNTPVRKKFLRTPTAEGAQVADLVEKIALSHPEISFRFISSNQSRLHTSGNHSLKDIIYTVFGREITANLIPIQSGAAPVQVEGFIGKPLIARGNRNYENYFINGRYIRSSLVSKAIEEAYKPYMMQHKYPFTMLQFTIEPTFLDVNVHPAKMELRFRDGEMIYKMIYHTVSMALSNRELIPTVELAGSNPSPRAGSSLGSVSSLESGSSLGTGSSQSFGSPLAVGAPISSEAPAALASSASSGAPAALAASAFSAPSQLRSGAPTLKPVRFREERPEPFEQKRREAVGESSPSDLLRDPAPGYGEKGMSPAASAPSAEGQAAPRQMDLFEDRLLTKTARAEHRLIGQLFDTYWLVQYHDNFYIIDQHAAHEKVLYEKTVASLKSREYTSQMVYPPIILTLNSSEQLLLEKYMEHFTSIGFEIEPFGGKEYAVRAVPANLFSIAKKELLMEMLDSLAGGMDSGTPDIINEKIASMSCKAAVKGNHSLSAAEADKLIDELLELQNPYACPHGRPTIITMSKYELEKKFKRIL